MATSSISVLIEALRKVLPEREAPYALHEPAFSGREWEYVKECIDTGWVSSAGSYVGKFEAALTEFTGAAAAVAMVNGTSALHMALLAVGVREQDEVLVPSLTFVATANAISYCRAIPHFVDSEARSLGIDAQKLESYLSSVTRRTDAGLLNIRTGRRISALVAMHTFGHPGDLDALSRVCSSFGLAFVEDAAESLGSLYRSRHTGNIGAVAALSFNGNKIVTTGGGGALITNDVVLARRIRHLATTAKLPHEWEFQHDQVGYNYRLPNLNAALGCAQLEQLHHFVSLKRSLAKRYQSAIEGINGISVFVEPEFARSNYWLNAIVLEEASLDQRDRVLRELNQAGIMARPVWNLMHGLPMYAQCPRMDLSCAEALAMKLINVPSSARIEVEHGR